MEEEHEEEIPDEEDDMEDEDEDDENQEDTFDLPSSDEETIDEIEIYLKLKI